MAQLLQPETGTADPRILRSRRMLMDSLAKLLIKRDFEDISIQEIADEATLNRATFYLHYADKNALLHAMTGVRFRDLMERREPLRSASATISLKAPAVLVSWLEYHSKAPSSRSSRACSSKALPITG